MKWRIGKRLIGVVTAFGVIGAFTGLAVGDVVITHKNGIQITVPADDSKVESITITQSDGVAFTVPINSQDVQSITFGKAGSAPVAQDNTPSPPKQQAAKAPAKKEPAPDKPKSASKGYEQEPIDPRELTKAAMNRAPGLPGGSEFIAQPVSSVQGNTPRAGTGNIIRVGPGHEYERPSDVVGVVKPGDIVEIEGGLYVDDEAVWTTSNITLRGVSGRPHLRMTVPISNRKAIWVIQGSDVVVDNIEFSGARVRDRNGAGIRIEGSHLTIKNSYFHHNQFALLSANFPDLETTVEHSEFAYNMREGTWAHGIYIGANKKFTLKNSYLHHNHRGHHVKSKAIDNYILYNRITDEDGIGSYLIETDGCGATYIIGNVLQQGQNAENFHAIKYGGAKCKTLPKGLWVVNNTYVNDRGDGVFVWNLTSAEAVIMNNLIVGGGVVAKGVALEENNIKKRRASFVDRVGYDFRLNADADAIDAGKPPGEGAGFDLTPVMQYMHPHGAQNRVVNDRIDVGAYEYTGR